MIGALSCGPGQRPSLATLAEQCYASAYQALDGGDDKNAQRLFALMAVLLPRDERPWIGLGVARERCEDWRAAAGLYEVGTVLSPSSVWCHFGRARALKRLGRQQQAETSFDLAEDMAEDELLVAAICAERNSP